MVAATCRWEGSAPHGWRSAWYATT
eukprot:COSAG06_NODE_60398_length_271_cov_0.593023_1_plen_24_part_10